MEKKYNSEHFKLNLSINRKRWAKFEEWWDEQPYKLKTENLLKAWDRSVNGGLLNDLTVDELSKLLKEKGFIIQRANSNPSTTINEDKIWKENEERLKMEKKLSSAQPVDDEIVDDEKMKEAHQPLSMLKTLKDIKEELYQNPQFLEIRERIKQSTN